MFSLTKKTEYGLLALIHLSGLETGRLANVSEIARSTAIPKELLAKILSELVKADLAVSFPGPTGGFRLGKDASIISLARAPASPETAAILTNPESSMSMVAPDSS